MRFVRHLALAAALSLSAPVAADLGADLTRDVSPALAAALDDAFSAEAAFIRRGKLKKRVTVGYKVVVNTQWDESDPTDTPIDTVEVAFPTVGEAGGSDTIPPKTSGFRLKNDKHFKGLISQFPATYSFSVTSSDADGSTTVIEAAVEGLEPIAGSEATVELEGGIKAHLKVLDTGYLKVRVFNEDGAWDPSVVESVALGGVDVPYVRTTRRFIANVDDSGLSADFGDGSSYTMAITAKDEDGTVVDSSTSSETVGGVVSETDIAKVRLTQANSGKLKVVTTTDGFDTRDHSVQLLVTDGNGETIVSSLDDMAAKTERLWAMHTLTFDDPSSATDQPYGVVLNLFGSDGSSLGASDYEIVVEGIVGLDTEPPPEGQPISIATAEGEITGRMAIKQSDATNFTLSIALSTDQVEGITVEFTDLIGNPTQPEEVAFDAPVYQVRTWRNTGPVLNDGPLYGSNPWSVSALILNGDDAVIDTVTATFDELPSTAYKRSGGGYLAGGNTTIKGSTIDLNP